jgi:hypothetical protein
VQAATDEEKNVRTKLLEYIDVLEKHMEAKQQAKEEKQRLMHESRMAASSALMIEAEGECDSGSGGGDDDEEGKLDIHALERKYRIRDVPLFIKSVSVIFGVVALFFIHPFVSSIHLNIPWIAILGALLLLVRTTTFSPLDTRTRPFIVCVVVRVASRVSCCVCCVACVDTDDHRREGVGAHPGQGGDGDPLLLRRPLRAHALPRGNGGDALLCPHDRRHCVHFPRGTHHGTHTAHTTHTRHTSRRTRCT